jgi:3-oxoadipate enol-lactonase
MSDCPTDGEPANSTLGSTAPCPAKKPQDGTRDRLLSNSLGTDLRLWDQVVHLLPPHLRIIRYDTRGHGSVGLFARPLFDGAGPRCRTFAAVLAVRDCVFVGLSIGGLRRPKHPQTFGSSPCAGATNIQDWKSKGDLARSIEKAETQVGTQMFAAIMERYFQALPNGPRVSLREWLRRHRRAGYAG